LNKTDRHKHVDDTHSLTGGDLEDLGRETDGAFDTELLVLSTVDQVVADCDDNLIRTPFQTNRKTKHVHFSRFLTLLLVSVILILWTLAGATGAPVASYSLSPFAT
jgi:hypothetical protein